MATAAHTARGTSLPARQRRHWILELTGRPEPGGTQLPLLARQGKFTDFLLKVSETDILRHSAVGERLVGLGDCFHFIG